MAFPTWKISVAIRALRLTSRRCSNVPMQDAHVVSHCVMGCLLATTSRHVPADCPISRTCALLLRVAKIGTTVSVDLQHSRQAVWRHPRVTVFLPEQADVRTRASSVPMRNVRTRSIMTVMALLTAKTMTAWAILPVPAARTALAIAGKTLAAAQKIAQAAATIPTAMTGNSATVPKPAHLQAPIQMLSAASRESL